MLNPPVISWFVYFSGAGTWLEGKRFISRTTVEELAEWAASLGIKP